MLTPEVLSQLSLLLGAPGGYAAQIRLAIEIAGKELALSRCSLYLESTEDREAICFCSWTDPGCEPLPIVPSQVRYASHHSFKESLRLSSNATFADVDDLPGDIKGMLESSGIRSFFVVPLIIGDKVNGFILGESRRQRSWTNRDEAVLKVVERLIAAHCAHRRLVGNRVVSEENSSNFFNAIDDIMLVCDLNGAILFANDGACQRLGFDREALIGKDILEIHPPEIHEQVRHAMAAIFRRERSHCSFDLFTRDRVRFPAETQVWFGEWSGKQCVFGIAKDLSTERAALQKFERLFHGNPAAMAVSNIEDRYFVDVNDAMIARFGYTREELIGNARIEEKLFADSRYPQEMETELLATGRVRNTEVLLKNRNGDLIHGLYSGDIIKLAGQRYLLSVMVDITEQIKLGRALKKERERLFNIIEGARLGTWEWHIPTGEAVFNERWASMLGYSLEDLHPTSAETWRRLAHPDDLAESGRLLNLHFEGVTDYYEFERRMRHKNGNWVWVVDRGKIVEYDEAGRPLLMSGIHVDITERKSLEQQIRDLAIRDPLTGVYNRRYIADRLAEIVAEHDRTMRPFCVSMIDIDHFKDVNDRYGHQAGDFILAEFARTIGKTIRQYDLLGRYGGEEFIIVSPGVTARETRRLVERVMKKLRQRPFIFESSEIVLTFSCGLADSDDFGDRAVIVEEMIALADNRLYNAKAAGRNCCIGP